MNTIVQFRQTTTLKTYIKDLSVIRIEILGSNNYISTNQQIGLLLALSSLEQVIDQYHLELISKRNHKRIENILEGIEEEERRLEISDY